MSYFDPNKAQDLSFPLLVLISLLLHINVSSSYALPFMVGGTMDGLGLDSAQAGFLATLEFAALAVTTILLSARISFWQLQRLAVVGTLLIVGGQFGSALVHDYELLGAMRLLVGVGEACFLGMMNGLIAVSSKPDRNFGYILALSTCVEAIILVILPYAMDFGHHRGLYMALGLLLIVSILPILKLLPERLNKQQIQRQEASISWTILFAYFVALALLFSTFGGISALTERIGLSVGLDSKAIGIGLGAFMVAQTVGAAFAGWFGTRFGRAMPFITGIMLCGIASLIITYSPNPIVYFCSLMLFGAFFMFTVTYVMGTAAAIDRSGRTAVATVGYIAIAYSIGPTLYGYIVLGEAYSAAGLPAFVACSLAAATVLLIVRTMGDHKIAMYQE